MKTKSILIVIFSLFVMSGLWAKNEKVVFSVSMDCQACQKKIEKNIAFEKGVKALDVNLEEKTVEVTYNDKKTDVAKLQKGFEKIGYEAIEKKRECCQGKTDVKCTKTEDKSKATCNDDCKKTTQK